jgi:hypothetical protein
MSKQIAIMKLLPSLEIAECINELLRELQSIGITFWIMKTVICLWIISNVMRRIHCIVSLKERRKDNEIVRN